MFGNLLAEMARIRISGKDVSKDIMSYGSWKNKIAGTTEFTLAEMVALREKYFPNLTLDYLFQPTGVKKKKGA